VSKRSSFDAPLDHTIGTDASPRFDADPADSGSRAPYDLRQLPAAKQEAPLPIRTHEFVNTGPARRLDQLLSERLPDLSRAYVQKLIAQGCVRIPEIRRDVKPSLKVPTGFTVCCEIPPPRKVDLSPQNIPIQILYQDEHLAVIDKPAGIAVHPAPSQMGHTLVNALLYWLDDLSGIGGEERPGIVHRLDKETSGVILVAKNDFAHRALALQFKYRTIHKCYQAIVRGEPSQWEGRIDHALGRSYSHSKKQMIRVDGTGREAITDYRVLEVFHGYTLMELYPKTGRTHQIRVHLANQRLPVASDKLYGREKRVFLSDLKNVRREPKEEPILTRHALHAANISFIHPLTREEIAFSAAMPPDMRQLLNALSTFRSPR